MNQKTTRLAIALIMASLVLAVIVAFAAALYYLIKYTYLIEFIYDWIQWTF